MKQHVIGVTGVQVLSTFENGRVEGFLDMRTLTPVDMTELPMALRIACRLKQFHNAPVSRAGSNSSGSEPFVTLWKWSASPHALLPQWCLLNPY